MKLEIQEPCHEDWGKMKVGLLSRHCEVCEKGVVDFTQQTRAEIITYILSNSNESVCGRMTRDQFDFRHEDIPVLIETLHKQRTPNPFLILALVSLSLSSCAQESGSQTVKTPKHATLGTLGEIAIAPPDSIPLDTTKDTICEIEIWKIEPVEVLQGDIAVERELFKGNIRMVEDPELNAAQKSDALKFAEKMPEFPGGVEKMMRYIKDNIKNPGGHKGNVYVRFIVEKDGSLTEIEILQSLENSNKLNKLVIKLVKGMPNWIPGTNNGQVERVYMSIPIRFQ